MKNALIWTASAVALAAVVYIAVVVMKEQAEKSKLKAKVNSVVQGAADALGWNTESE